MRYPSRLLGVLSSSLAIVLLLNSRSLAAQATQPAPATSAPQVLSLQECLRIAMEKNHTRPASQFAIAMAEAQHRQALAAYWPQLNAKAGITSMEHDLNFIFPASEFVIPPQSVTIPGGAAMVTIPANAFGPGFPPTNVQLPVSYPGQTVTTALQQFPIPAQNIKLADKTTETLDGSLKMLLVDGGMRKGYREQSLGAIDAAKADARRTDIELTDSVVRIYYGAVLAHQLRALGEETLERMEATLKLTESLYKEGAGTVTKADYLDNLVMVDTVRSIVAPLQENEVTAQAALAYTMGLSWKESVVPADAAVPFEPYQGNLDELVSTAYEFNPDWKKVEAGLRAFEGERRAAASDHYPKLGITGNLHRFWNGYNGGISTGSNRSGWTVGAGVEIPIFDGFLTSAKVAEAQAKINKLKEEKLQLREGIGLQLRALFLNLAASEKTSAATLDAMKAAADDRDLNLRAYQGGLVATEKVIRAQLQESLVSARYYRAVYEHRALQSSIDMVVGREIQGQLSAAR